MAELKPNSSSEPASKAFETNPERVSELNKDIQEVPPKNRIDNNNKMWVPIASVNEYITCGICKGYLYEASTITECMHSFCKSCIVRHLDHSLHCPTCSILIHPTDPFVHIRLDRLLQDIVYGLLPALAEVWRSFGPISSEELAKEKRFYAENDSKLLSLPETKTGWEPSQTHSLLHPDIKLEHMAPLVSLCLQCKCSSLLERKLEKKFVRVTGEATINSVVLFLRKKLVLTEDYVVELYGCNAEGCVSLEPSHTLSTVKEQYFKQEEFLQLEYEVSPRQWLRV